MTDERPTVLVVDDDRANRAALSEILRTDYRVLLAKDGRDALEILADGTEDVVLVLLDIAMPRMDGYALLEHLRASETGQSIPVIIITGEDSEAEEERGLLLGAADFMRKPVRPPIVHARVRNLVALSQQRRELERLAHSDGLTGIANRRAFDTALDKACRLAARNGTSISLAIIDIDYFKRYNDHYGHLAGDEALRQVACLLQKHVRRPDDVAARFGGEEFVALLPACSDPAERMEQFRLDVLNAGIAHEANAASSFLTVSCGVLLVSRLAHPVRVPDMLDAADTLLYQAKHAGRNRIVFARM